jgi:hypothetical protein
MIMMFHVQNELQKELLRDQFKKMPNPNVVITCKSQILTLKA